MDNVLRKQTTKKLALLNKRASVMMERRKSVMVSYSGSLPSGLNVERLIAANELAVKNLQVPKGM